MCWVPCAAIVVRSWLRPYKLIGQEGAGIIIYLRQEGRGIGLLDKLRAYNLQDQGYDTVDANLLLGHGEDERDYATAALILKDLGVPSVRLLTNNPLKIESLQAFGIPVAARVPLPPRVTTENATYLLTKVRRMHHLLNLDAFAGVLPGGSNGIKAEPLHRMAPTTRAVGALRQRCRNGTSASGRAGRWDSPGPW